MRSIQNANSHPSNTTNASHFVIKRPTRRLVIYNYSFDPLAPYFDYNAKHIY